WLSIGPKGRRAKFVPWMDPFLKRSGKAPTPAGSRMACRVYVSDIHGRDDLLRQMAERVEADTEPSSLRGMQSLNRYSCDCWTGAPEPLSHRLRRCPSRGRKFVSADNGGPNQ